MTSSHFRDSNLLSNRLQIAQIVPKMPRYDEKGVNTPITNYRPNLGQKNAWEQFCDLNDVFPRYRNASIDNLTIPDQDGETFTQLAHKYLARPRSLILFGRAGRGKTHFMFAILKALFDKGFMQLGDVRYFDHVDLERRIQEELQKYKSSRYIIETISTVPILLIDDFGIDTGTARHERDFYEVFNKRFGKELITILSTNLDNKSLRSAYGERIYSRLNEAISVNFNGPDLRAQE